MHLHAETGNNIVVALQLNETSVSPAFGSVAGLPVS
ncbi:MAG: hypothetical protein JWO59_490 [Chloroflexi bacterium]|jgi:hypothetical protein|nr:hypothetical protein [Chloroflexota bacterium]MDB5074436.1 hypothetical protein [Chloroflexota bacterium]